MQLLRAHAIKPQLIETDLKTEAATKSDKLTSIVSAVVMR